MAKQPRFITEINGKQIAGKEGEVIRIEASYGIAVGHLLREQARAEEIQRRRPIDVEDRASVKRAMLAVEARLVEALWTLARLPGGGSGSGRCGIEYFHDAAERWASAVEKGWQQPMPRPARPSPRAIDAMHEPLEWLALLPKPQAMLVSVAAGTKRGDVERNISWRRVRSSLIETQTYSIGHLQHRYKAGIREIVARLTERAMLNRD